MANAEADRRLIYRFEGFVLDLGRGALLSTAGHEVALRPKSFLLLCLLVENAGRLLSRDEIMQAVWPDVFVTEDNVTQCVHDIRRALGPSANELLRSVPRRGYIFAGAVSHTAQPTSPVASATSAAVGRHIVGETYKPSLTVLPFANLSGDPDQEFFSDGIAQDIITELSRSRALFVIARNSSFTYKGNVDVRQVAHELGVRYVLEGSVRRAGDRIRVSAQLIDTETGIHLWAERYDRDIAHVFAVQDEITRAVALAIEPAIADAEQQRALRRPPGSLGAWEAYQRGLWHQTRFDVAENIAARRFFEQAAALDPTFSPAYQGLVHTYVDENRLYFTRNLEETVRAAAPLAREAVALDRNDAGAHAAVGWVSLTQGDLELALEAAERALALNPNSADAYRLRGTGLVFAGQHDTGHQVLLGYLRLNPHDPRNWHAVHIIAMARYLLADYEGAVDAARRALRANPRQPLSYRWLAAALGQLGQTEEAGDVLRMAPANVAPLAFDDYVQRRWPWQRREDHDHMLDGLRKAGWRLSRSV